MTTGWRMDAASLRASRNYACFDGNATIDTQLRVGQAGGDGSHPTLASVGWTGGWSDALGGMNLDATVRSDGSVWMAGNWDLFSKTGVDFLKDVKFNSQLVDDGTKAGGVQIGWAGSNGPFNHEFTTTIGNRVSRFEEFVSYKHSDNFRLAVASQG